MKLLPVNKQPAVRLNHRALHIDSAAESRTVLAASRDGKVTIVAEQSLASAPITISATIQQLSVHPSREIFAVIDEESGALNVFSMSATFLCRHQPPAPQSSRLAPGFLSCRFLTSGDRILVVHRSEDGLIAQLLAFDIAKGVRGITLLSSIEIDSLFVEPGCILLGTPLPNLIGLLVTAGQEGSLLHWLETSGDGLTLRNERQLYDVTPPVFSPDGARCAVLDQLGDLRSYTFPELSLIASAACAAQDDESFTECFAFLDSQTLVAKSTNNRLFLLDANSMIQTGELLIEDHEPKPSSAYYSDLEELTLCTDIDFFHRSSQYLILVHRHNRSSALSDWKDSLTFIPDSRLSHRPVDHASS